MISDCQFTANGSHTCMQPHTQGKGEGFTSDYYPYHSDYTGYNGYNGYNGYPTFDVGYQPGYANTVIIREQPVYVHEYPPQYYAGYSYYPTYPRRHRYHDSDYNHDGYHRRQQRRHYDHDDDNAQTEEEKPRKKKPAAPAAPQPTAVTTNPSAKGGTWRASYRSMSS